MSKNRLPVTSPGLAVGFAALLAWSTARADIVFTLGNNPQPGEENVLLNKGSTGSTVSGNTNQSNIEVDFHSNTQTLFEPSNGQARIEAVDATGGQVAVTDISSITVPGGFFGDMIFNPHIGGNVGNGGAATVTALDGLSNPWVFNYPGSGLGNGENFLTITTTNGESITSVAISAPGGFTDLRQVRISGADIGSPPVGGRVPEPGAGTIACGFALGLLVIRRLRLFRD